MSVKGGKSLFSLTTLLASFFGAAMIAGAFAYFNYKFSEYKFIDFKEWVFYEKNRIFTPSHESYIVVFFSSKEPGAIEQLSSLDFNLPILAIDYYNEALPNSATTTFLRGGTKNSLNFIQRFNIYDSPSIFFIKKVKESLYKQDSMIRKLDKIDSIHREVNNL